MERLYYLKNLIFLNLQIKFCFENYGHTYWELFKIKVITVSIISELVKISKLNDNQKRRWRKDRIVPIQVLDMVYQSGIRFNTEPPETGIGLKSFLEILWEYACSCTNSNTCAAAVALYENTVKFELMPDWRDKVRAKKPKIQWRAKKEKPITVKIEHF